MWLLVGLLFVLAFVSLVMPMIPGVLMIWAGFLVYHFLIDNTTLSWLFWLVMIILTVISLVSDYVAGSYFVKKYGGSQAGEITAAIGVIVGSFILPPFGIIVVPFIAVLLIELLATRNIRQALQSSIGSLFGFLTSTMAKFLILVLMVSWFFADVYVNF
ncbi:DUF456 domain-containing protein [Macrococcus hajekii]|uniref:DUF456 domain-containing protein n=1 Tax=Macrococcus hajekii TaxID=198482 RepID=A0A4R6BIS0_9STAP|nr:DUF456 domain-containing protein [Macrococcus hajekii]TDM01549.1 DUF456 domain-containing protein [Macrococcus hajekii]GGB00914.1 membrane protein [Macrococcus hajekii]